MKYRAIRDYKIIPEGSIIIPDSNGEYIYSIEKDDIVTSISLSTDILNDVGYFEPYKSVEISISEQDIDDIESKNWRVVFNINCTERKLMEIKKFIENGIEDII